MEGCVKIIGCYRAIQILSESDARHAKKWLRFIQGKVEKIQATVEQVATTLDDLEEDFSRILIEREGRGFFAYLKQRYSLMRQNNLSGEVDVLNRAMNAVFLGKFHQFNVREWLTEEAYNRG